MKLKIAISLIYGESKKAYTMFKTGQFVFKDELSNYLIDTCWETILYIKKMNGFCVFTDSAKFWKAMIKLFSHPDFEKKKWVFNLERLVARVTPKASVNDYIQLFFDIYNWKNTKKIHMDLYEG